MSLSRMSFAFAILCPAGETHLTSAFLLRKSSIFLYASITVAWFLLPMTFPISGYDIFVYLLARYMQNARAREMVLSFFEE